MKTIHKLERPKLPETPKLKVAAYARVSTASDEQLSSLYSVKIKNSGSPVSMYN